MKRVFWILFGLIFSFSCGKPLPKGVVSQKKMEEILLDVHVLDGRLSNLPLDSTRARIDSYYEQLFRYHKIDSSIFKQSVDYYSSHPSVLKEIYTRIEATLKKDLEVEQERNMKIYEAQRVKDSIFQAGVQDSIRVAQKAAVRFRMLRDILFRHEADTTRDKPLPYTFDRYSIKLFEDQNLWKLDFGIRDTLMESFHKSDAWNSLKSPTVEGQSKKDSMARADSLKLLRGPHLIVDPKSKSERKLIIPEQSH